MYKIQIENIKEISVLLHSWIKRWNSQHVPSGAEASLVVFAWVEGVVSNGSVVRFVALCVVKVFNVCSLGLLVVTRNMEWSKISINATLKNRYKEENFVYREAYIYTVTKSTCLLANLTDPVIRAEIDCDILTPNIAVNTLWASYKN